jgi:hypothetical protein
MKQVDANRLREIIESEVESDTEQMLYKDAFVAGCYLHKAGHYAAAGKLCNGVLKSLGYNKRKTYFTALLGNMSGNEDLYAQGMCAHHEINELFRS